MRIERVEGDELIALLTLLALPELPVKKLRALLRRYRSAVRALAAPGDELGSAAVAARWRPATRQRVDAALRVIEADAVTVLTEDTPGYPHRFRHLAQPPPVLFARGDLSLLELPAVAVIGSRAATQLGRQRARKLGQTLARAGATVVSGFARGIDGAAHRGALDANGATIAVLGAGIDVRYPRQHNRMRSEIAASGLLLSEFMPGELPLPFHFPRRNRLIAAQAAAIICVEAAENSGAIGTVGHALDLGRSIFVLRQPAGSKNSAGISQLIEDGASVLNRTEDVLEDGVELMRLIPNLARVRAEMERSQPVAADGAAQRILASLGPEAVHVDRIAAAAGIGTAEALASLVELELEGEVCQVPGGRYVRGAQV